MSVPTIRTSASRTRQPISAGTRARLGGGEVVRGLRRRARLLGAVFRPPGPGGAVYEPTPVRVYSTRLVPSPVFVFCPERSGSTLLRVLLDSHTGICAPPELHLRTLQVRLGREFTATAMAELGLDHDELEHLLWDRVLHRELYRSGKEIVVDKTPANVLRWQRIARAWPEARYLFLLRHPGAIAESVLARRRGADPATVLAEVARYTDAVTQARAELPGLTVRYEDLTADPAATIQTVCAYLGVAWEPGMLEYGRFRHGRFQPFLGDWSANVRSGVVQLARPLPADDDVPSVLRQVAREWGYLGRAAGLRSVVS